MDFAALIAALGDGPAGGTSTGGTGAAGEDAVLDAIEQGGSPLPAGVVAARVAERLAPGPDLVAWLATAPAGDLSDYDLAGAASSWRRVVSWAQSQELAVVAQLASRAAKRDKNIETDPDGRPSRVSAAAAAEVALSLTMSQYSASVWTDLAVDLQWRLAATGAALAAGEVDLPRARLIAEATGLLTESAAPAVETRVLPAAGKQTTGMLRAALRRAVIAVDPDGAERRKKDAERRARVRLYPEEEGTATLTAQGLPAVSAAAAMARLTAMAAAMKSAGAGGGMDFLRAQVLAGLLLGTLPLIPPATGAPPDGEPGDDPSKGPDSFGTGPAGGGPGSGSGGGPGGDFDDGPWAGFPDPADEDAPDAGADDHITGPSVLTGRYEPGSSYRPRQGPPQDGWLGPRDDQDWLETGPLPGWPALPAVIRPGLVAPAPGPGTPRPGAGLLDVSVPWQTLAGISPEPGHLGRIGPITATEARQLASCAARDPASIWRVIITNRTGQALAVTRLPRPRGRPPGDAPGPGPGDGTGLVGRITLTIPEDILDGEPPSPPLPGRDPLPGSGPPAILRQAFQHAAKALAHARAAAQADTAAGGCAHLMASPAYQIPPRLRDYLVARDLTCRFITCRQPAWLCDIDHTKPYNQGGGTCTCNCGGLCRVHHQIKQLPGWSLRQVSSGVFLWTTPGGRTYTATPDTHPV